MSEQILDKSVSRNTITAETLRDFLDRGEPVTVLDVRRAEDHAEWSIPGSLHADVYDALRSGDLDALADVELPGETPVVTVCNVGRTSKIAAEQLRARGIRALSLEGGMKAWSLAWNTAEIPITNSEARVIQVRRTGKGCLSYIVGSESEALVIDAALDPEVYLGITHDHGWEITGVVETHVHADHLSRSRSLADLSGATLYLPVQNRVSYPFAPLRDTDVLKVGAATLKAMRTPGHTLESTSYLLDGRALLTGDTLFLTGVGRPDLEASPEEARMRAHALYRSLKRILGLPSDTLVLPGHTSEPISFDGEPISTTLGEARERIEAFSMSEEEFVERLLARIPPTPPNYERIVRLNEDGKLPSGDPTDLEAGANRCAAG